MLKIIEYLSSGLVLSAITAISLGLSAGAVNAQDDEDEKEKEASAREVLVDCDKGQSVTQTLVQFANDTKPLEIIIKGNCVNNEEEVQIERNKVDLVGDEENPGTIPTMLVDGGRQIGIGGNLTLAGGLGISAGQVEIGTESDVMVNLAIFVTSHSLLRITTEGSGQVEINGFVTVENHSLLEVQREVNEGIVIFIGEINLGLQSSLWMRDAIAGNLVLQNDSHGVLVGDNVSGNEIWCDSESRIWGYTDDFSVLSDLNGLSCEGS